MAKSWMSQNIFLKKSLVQSQSSHNHIAHKHRRRATTFRGKQEENPRERHTIWKYIFTMWHHPKGIKKLKIEQASSERKNEINTLRDTSIKHGRKKRWESRSASPTQHKHKQHKITMLCDMTICGEGSNVCGVYISFYRVASPCPENDSAWKAELLLHENINASAYVFVSLRCRCFSPTFFSSLRFFPVLCALSTAGGLELLFFIFLLSADESVVCVLLLLIHFPCGWYLFISSGNFLFVLLFAVDILQHISPGIFLRAAI